MSDKQGFIEYVMIYIYTYIYREREIMDMFHYIYISSEFPHFKPLVIDKVLPIIGKIHTSMIEQIYSGWSDLLIKPILWNKTCFTNYSTSNTHIFVYIFFSCFFLQIYICIYIYVYIYIYLYTQVIVISLNNCWLHPHVPSICSHVPIFKQHFFLWFSELYHLLMGGLFEIGSFG